MEIIKDKNEIKYLEAKKRVKKLKGFYIHLTIYVLVNLVIVLINYQDLKPGESYFKYENFITLFFWGIGLLAHAMSVFVPQFVLGKNWEERKIRELMDKEK
ncbi:2TM domain-containing protein [Epilithonimonas lactis]|uniref:Histidine kinase n=1 Tax=Epilithonimonas lactis TaxID=421072 RepID=A0A085BMN0_9FLAO|nr:2TM domain-containing protein [Epilithonimonas lactis]KFC23725.1 histidine kinase [Epilithonimonas lactis]SEQ23070.1 2TM domain-containing protein [Epilithonimonas lactis]